MAEYFADSTAKHPVFQLECDNANWPSSLELMAYDSQIKLPQSKTAEAGKDGPAAPGNSVGPQTDTNPLKVDTKLEFKTEEPKLAPLEKPLDLIPDDVTERLVSRCYEKPNDYNAVLERIQGYDKAYRAKPPLDAIKARDLKYELEWIFLKVAPQVPALYASAIWDQISDQSGIDNRKLKTFLRAVNNNGGIVEAAAANCLPQMHIHTVHDLREFVKEARTQVKDSQEYKRLCEPGEFDKISNCPVGGFNPNNIGTSELGIAVDVYKLKDIVKERRQHFSDSENKLHPGPDTPESIKATLAEKKAADAKLMAEDAIKKADQLAQKANDMEKNNASHDDLKKALDDARDARNQSYDLIHEGKKLRDEATILRSLAQGQKNRAGGDLDSDRSKIIAPLFVILNHAELEDFNGEIKREGLINFTP